MFPRQIQGAEILSNKFRFQVGDILYGKLRPNLNKVAVAREAGICSTDVWVLRPTQEIVSDFALGVLSSTWLVSRVLAYTKGDLPRADATDFDSIVLPLPPVSEQRRIAAIIYEADAVRRYQVEAMSSAAEVIPALFQQMFGSVLKPRHVQPLVKVAEVVSGVAKGRSLNTSSTREIPYLRVANVQDGHLDLSEIKTVPATEDEIAELRLKQDDVVMTEGGDEDKLGRGAMWRGEIAECIHQNHIFRVRPNQGVLDGVWFSWFLRTETARAYFLRAAKRTTNLASINMSQLKVLPVPVPPYESQLRFRALVEEFEHTPSFNDSGSLISELRAALLAQALSGSLTARWREKNHTSLMAEAAERDALLNARGVRSAAVTVTTRSDDDSDDGIFATPTSGAWADLTARQRVLWRFIPVKGAFGIEDLLHARAKEAEFADLSEDGFRRELEVFAARGLLVCVSRSQPASGGELFRHYYRRVRYPVRPPGHGEDVVGVMEGHNEPAVRELVAHLRDRLSP